MIATYFDIFHGQDWQMRLILNFKKKIYWTFYFYFIKIKSKYFFLLVDLKLVVTNKLLIRVIIESIFSKILNSSLMNNMIEKTDYTKSDKSNFSTKINYQ